MFTITPKHHLLYEFLRGLEQEVFCRGITSTGEEYIVFLKDGSEKEIADLHLHFDFSGYKVNKSAVNLTSSWFANLPIKQWDHFGINGTGIITFVPPEDRQLVLAFIHNCNLIYAARKSLSNDDRMLAYELAKARYLELSLEDIAVNK